MAAKAVRAAMSLNILKFIVEEIACLRRVCEVVACSGSCSGSCGDDDDDDDEERK